MQDRILKFAEGMDAKFSKGESEHGNTIRIDPYDEAMDECLDLANYAMIAYWRIAKLKEKVSSLEGR